jgi:transcription-repair coupling factor (superfamily II helicase)
MKPVICTICLCVQFLMACALFPSMKSWSRHAVLRSELVASDEPIKHLEEVEVSKLDAIKRVSTMRSGSTQIGHKGRMATIFPNDFVVHRDKGVAQFRDEVLDEVSGERNVVLLFQNKEEYVVKGSERSKLSRLKASDSSSPPKLSALTARGTEAWQETLNKVRQSTRLEAESILDLYAARSCLFRDPCPPDDAEFIRFEKKFEYTPTTDQLC